VRVSYARMLALCSLVTLCTIAGAQQRSSEAVNPVHDIDPLVGVWKCVEDCGCTNEAGTKGAVIQVTCDSITCEYTGYLLVPTESLTAYGWSAGDAMWRNFRYVGSLCWYTSKTDYWKYVGAFVLRQLNQVTPNRKAHTDREFRCGLNVFVRPCGSSEKLRRNCLERFGRVLGDTTLDVVVAEHSTRSTWEKVEW
jgi:hypothetical protein